MKLKNMYVCVCFLTFVKLIYTHVVLRVMFLYLYQWQF